LSSRFSWDASAKAHLAHYDEIQAPTGTAMLAAR